MSKQKIITHLWFDKEAVEAAKFYTSIFPDSKITNITTIHNTPSGDCDTVSFELMGQKYMAISAGPYFKFTPAISLLVKCDTQEEIDRYSDALSAVPDAEQCGWVTDKYGLSWQLSPTRLDEMMTCGDQEKVDRVVQAFLKMKRFNIEKLEEAFRG